MIRPKKMSSIDNFAKFFFCFVISYLKFLIWINQITIYFTWWWCHINLTPYWMVEVSCLIIIYLSLLFSYLSVNWLTDLHPVIMRCLNLNGAPTKIVSAFCIYTTLYFVVHNYIIIHFQSFHIKGIINSCWTFFFECIH